MVKLFHIGIEAGTGKWLSAAFNKLTICTEVRPHESPDYIRNIYNSMKPDIVFMQLQSDFPAHLQLVQEMSKNTVVINWCGDVRDPIPEWYFRFDPYCITCFSNMRDVNKMNGEYLQIGIDPEIYYPKKIEKKYDIVFMANRSLGFPLSKYREDVVEFLKGIYGSRFKVFGNWPNCDGSFMGNQKGEADIYRKSKIGISVSHFDIDRYFSDRLIRIMGSGCFALSHHYSGIEQDFKPSRNLETFETFGELKAKIDHYLENDRDRELIARNGADVVRRRFTTKNMVEDILKIYKKYKK